MSITKVWSRRPDAEEKAWQPPAPAGPIAAPPSDVEALKQDGGDSFTLASFTHEDAWVLGNLLRRRWSRSRSPTAGRSCSRPSRGPGVMPDNETWVQRERNTVLRWGCSTWLMHCKYDGDEGAFRDKFGMQVSADVAAEYAIHGGAVPIRVKGG
ncbi:hypothetical protein DHEL01_v210765 [Diaporthe helianthi]|uniref:Uncharacterized protein n=1 Tax=Diaporthe helianthi TaxID=158607 RepID=A0A2P5HKT8_DIAHE|nr:hypothetical protein DHEL01_v210765 [Diaporthe helianthi]